MTKIELIALLLSVTFVLIAEMLNTAVEAAIDIATTSFDPMAKLAKDIAAGAVLIAAVNALAVGYIVFSGKVADRSSNLLDRLRHEPAELTLVALVLTIIIVIATKAYTGRGTPLRGGAPSGHAALAFAGWMAATYVGGRGSSLPHLVDRADHGDPRRPDARRVGRPLGARGHVRRARRRAGDARGIPGVLVNELVQKAIEAAGNAYAPYSNYDVGAVVRTTDGREFAGVNVENAAYPLGAVRGEDRDRRRGRGRLPPRRHRRDRDQCLARAAAAASGCYEWRIPEVSFRRDDGTIATYSAAELLPETWNLPE